MVGTGMRPKWEPSIYAFQVYSKILHTNIWQKYCKIPVCYSVFPNTAKFHAQNFHVESQTSHVSVVPKEIVFPVIYSWYHFLRTSDHTPQSSLILPSLLPLLALISHNFLWILFCKDNQYLEIKCFSWQMFFLQYLHRTISGNGIWHAA